MRCSNCGKDNEEGTRICPWCGSRMGPSYAVESGPKSRKIAVAVLVVIVLAVAAVIAVNAMNNGSDYTSDGPSDTDPVTPVTPDDSSDTTVSIEYPITYTSDDSDLFTVSYGTNDEGKVTVTVTLTASEASKYSRFTWYVYKDTGSSFDRYMMSSTTKTEATATWTFKDGTYGTYVFGVSCDKSSGQGRWSPPDTTEYTLTFEVSGTVYSWEYKGTDLIFSLPYSYSEYEKYAGTNGASMKTRAGNNNADYYLITDKFVVVNSTVSDMKSNLESLYIKNFGTDTTGQGYAEFILAFVQECFTYKTDTYLYRQSEYYAFPMETIYNGGGDCEDTSILCAALYKAAGYNTGVFLIPGHAVAAVALDGYVAGDVSSEYQSSVAVFSLEKNGETYYGCETTLSSNEFGVGYISTNWKIVDGVIYYKNEAYTDGNYGLYLVDSTA